ncbi:MAG TPA: hypothetical protein VE291_00715 [Terracidiphilus sp.]|jgi:hypothetical protein|nr:hypothetical protein [Terracidiphilus sp.]
MKYSMALAAPLCALCSVLTLGSAPQAHAQADSGNARGPSKYLFLDNVALKPNAGEAYSKLEADETRILRAAHAPSHYFGAWSITGGDHVLTFNGFDSFAELAKDHEATMALPGLMDNLKADNAAEAALIAEHHSSIYKYDEDLSLRAPLDITKQRFARILLFHVRSGRGQDFEHLIKVYAKEYEVFPEAHWAMFEKVYGQGSDNTYILVTPFVSVDYVDHMVGSGPKFAASTGLDLLQMLRQQASADVESSESDLYAFGPSISYVPDSWIASSPDFWGKK